MRKSISKTKFESEVNSGNRFEFGKNWKNYLSNLTDERIQIAQQSILKMLDIKRLDNMRVLDVGSGSGLFSLAARNLGALVHSFDYDPTSVSCTSSLKSRYYPNDENWKIEQGSILDNQFLDKLGKYDIVYSWGVLHHTGNMWKALENVSSLVKENGLLYIAIYNDQGWRSVIWKKVKKLYCSGVVGKYFVTFVYLPIFFIKTCMLSLLSKRNIFAEYKKNRGMSVYWDWIDWLGGYPFEVAKIEDIFNYYKEKGFILKNIKSNNGLGNNVFVFIKNVNIDLI